MKQILLNFIVLGNESGILLFDSVEREAAKGEIQPPK
jgi:hypothetical protein